MLHLVHVSILRGAATNQRMLTLAWESVWGASPTGATEQAACRQSTGVPLTTSGISGNRAIVRSGGSCQAAAGPLCCQATVAG